MPLRTMRSIRYGQKPGTIGLGLGSLFSRLGRYVTPLLRTAVRAARPAAKRTLKKLGQQGIQAATSTLMDSVVDNIPLKEAAKNNLQKTLPKMKKTTMAGVKRVAQQVSQGKTIKRAKAGRQVTHSQSARGKRTVNKKSHPYKGIFSS